MEPNKKERENLMKMPGDFKQMSSGSWLSKHISSPLAMGKTHSMAPKMDGPLEGNLFGKAMADNNGNYEKAKASLAPQMNQAPTMNKGSMAYKQGEKDKDDESISGRLGKIGSNISNKDRRDESLGNYGTRTK